VLSATVPACAVEGDVRGVLGNKCAGQHNLKTLRFKETIVKVIFCHGHQQFMFFFAALYLPQKSGGELSCSDSGGDPLNTLLEGALGQ
jgi:hypothetical protein